MSPIQKAHYGDSLHHTRRRVPQEFTAWLQTAVNSNVVLGSHVEVAGFRGMVRGLLGDIVAFRVVWELPIASERLAEDWVEGFLYSTGYQISIPFS